MPEVQAQGTKGVELGLGVRCAGGLIVTIARVFAAYLVLCLTACGGGGGSGGSGGSGNPPAPGGGSGSAPSGPRLAQLHPEELVMELVWGAPTRGRITFRNEGNETLAFDVAHDIERVSLHKESGSVVPRGEADVTFTISCYPDDQVAGEFVVTTNERPARSLSVPLSTRCGPVEGIARVTLNQGAQAFDSLESGFEPIDLVADRDLRLTAWVLGEGESPAGRVIVSVPGRQPEAYPLEAPVYLQPIILDGDFYAYRVTIAGDDVQPGVTLRIEIDQPAGDPLRFPAAAPLSPEVVDLEPFRITFVPITFDGRTPDVSEEWYFVGARRVLPLGSYEVRVRTPYTFTGAFDLQRMLGDMKQLRALDGSSDLYFGIAPAPAGTSSNVVGVALLGEPVSVAVERDYFSFDWSVPHELGHNFGLRHAPACNAPGPDPAFPSSQGRVVLPGFDVNGGGIVPSSSFDFMGYCGGQEVWVSDYHFRRALQFRKRQSTSSGSTGSGGLLVSGNYQAGVWTDVSMIPTEHVRVDGPPGAGDFVFTAWDAGADEVVRQSFSLHAVADVEDGHMFAFIVPLPAGQIGSYQIERREGGVELLETIPRETSTVPPSITWAGRSATVVWRRQPGSALVVRDDNGTIVGIDRTGSIQLNDLRSLSLELHRGGRTVSVERSRRPVAGGR